MSQTKLVMACVAFGALGCAAGESTPAEPSGQASVEQAFKRATAEQLASALSDAPTREWLVTELRQKGSLALSELSSLVGETGSDLGGEAVPEVWLREPEGTSAIAELLVAYAPAGNELSWTEVPAYRLGGARVTLDARQAPDLPVLVIETHGRLAMAKGIEAANRSLQVAGLQHAAPKLGSLATTSVATTKLDAIRLADDKEPWISGAAEVYAVVSGVIGDNQPEVLIVDMPYLDKDGTTYNPNQLVINWSNFGYQAANIQLFEHDDNTNYQDLVIVLVDAIGAVGSLAGYPVVAAITEIANRIIAAMPAGVFTNDDDYVDSFYTIEKTKTYAGLAGAGRNATVSLSPFVLQPN